MLPFSAAANSDEKLLEVPYHFLGKEERWIMAYAMRANNQCQGYQVWSNRGTGALYQTNNLSIFTPSGTLQSAYNKNTSALDTTGFVLIPGRDIDYLSTVTDAEFEQGMNLLQIDDEIMA